MIKKRIRAGGFTDRNINLGSTTKSVTAADGNK